MPEWKVRLSGERDDLEALTSFKGKDWRVAKKDDGYYLQAAAFAQLNRADDVWTSAEALITIVNGAAKLDSDEFKPVAPDHVARFHDDGHKDAFIFLSETLNLTARMGRPTLLVNGVPQETESWPNLESWVRLAQRDGNVAKALRIITSRELNPVNLYKLYEIVRDDVGNESAMIQRNWATRNQLSAFRRSMNHPAASGAGARHARMEEDPPTDPMSEDQARAFVRGLLRAWLTAKG